MDAADEAATNDNRRPPRVLVSSAGRRVGLVRLFQDAVYPLGGTVSTTDMSELAAASLASDAHHRVPSVHDSTFVDRLLEICAEHGITLLIPTIDTELAILSTARDRFCAIGTDVMVSGHDTIAICSNKVATHEFLTANRFPVPRQADVSDVLSRPHEWDWPVLCKPTTGSASTGVHVVHDPEELDRLAGPESIVQSLARGHELTVDVYVNVAGCPLMAVPRQRLEVRAGEVSKAVTVAHAGAQDLALDIVRALPSPKGCLNVQMFADGSDLTVIEINARFGGGFPLTSKAGARFIDWMIAEARGQEPAVGPWQEGLFMLRFDDAVFSTDLSHPNL